MPKNELADLMQVCQNLLPCYKRALERSGQNIKIIIDFIHGCETEKNISPKSKQGYVDVLSKFSNFHNNKHFKKVTRGDIIAFLNSFRKPEELDPLHKWIGTYNLYKVLLDYFFKWLYYSAAGPENRPKPACIENIPRLKRKEKSVYKPSDLWSVEDDILFLKYCPFPRERCYHAMSKDSSCRPHELLKLRIKDIVFKEISGKKYAEIVVSGKTGQRHMPLINCIPYLKDWLDNHPMKNIPTNPLICSTGKVLGQKIRSAAVREMYLRMKEYFTKLLEDPRVLPEDKPKIRNLLSKPWNPYVFRHSALTEKSKMLKESHLRQHAGWSITSNMPQVYLHYFGNESSSSILEAYGLKPQSLDVDKLKPKECPNCSSPNKIDSKFCSKCRMILSYDAYTETVEEKQRDNDALTTLFDKVMKMNEEIQELKANR